MQEKFEHSFEIFQEELKELLIAQHKELVEALRSLPPPAPAPNPLEFYETIAKIRTHRNFSHNLYFQDFPQPYFAEVVNDIVSYLGGELTIDWRGRKLQEEAKKRFAYLLFLEQISPCFRDK